MKLGDVLAKERRARGLTEAEVADQLGVTEADVQHLESGNSEIETWGPVLAALAVALEIPTSRLLAESGRSADCLVSQAGPRIRARREHQGLSVAGLADQIGLDPEQYATVEAGTSPLEVVGPRLLAFAEQIEQPVFNLFYPCGLPFQELEDYP